MASIKGLNYIHSETISLPIKIKKFCILSSPHINKDSRDHFEVRIYKEILDISFSKLTKNIDIFFGLKLPNSIKIKAMLLF